MREVYCTAYIFFCLDIFEPSAQQRLDFVDIQEGDTICEASDDEIVAHSGEQKTYERTDVAETDSDNSEDLSRLPPVDMGMDTFGIDVDMALNNGIADDSEENDEPLEVGKEGRNRASDNIETSLVTVKENRKGDDKLVEEHKMKDETEQVELPKVKGKEKQVETRDNGQMVKQKGENETKQVRGQKDDEIEEEESGNEENEMGKVEDKKELDDKEVEDDDSDGTTEVDKLLVDKTSVEKQINQQKTKSKMISSGTQAHEVEPLLNTSQTPSPLLTPSPAHTPSPEPQESPREKKPFTPREYPGKAVKSIAIGTDDDYLFNEYERQRHTSASPGHAQKKGSKSKGSTLGTRSPIENGVHSATKAGSLKSGRTPTSTHQKRDGDIPISRSGKIPLGERDSQSSDAMFFKQRITQTSKRRPKRHVWLVRDSEIHRLIAEKAAILRRYKEEGITGL